MSDEDALLNAIALHPDEDTPRLMFADWLDEHGCSVRAEFIRTQLEIARIEHLPRAELNRHVAVFRRNQELPDAHQAELLGADLPTVRVEFHRGFACELTLSAFRFHQSWDVIATMRPLPRVAVEDTLDVVRRFLGFDSYLEASERTVPLVTSVSTVAPNDPPAEDFDPDNSALVLEWPRLKALDLSGCGLGDENAAVLVRSSFPMLADLYLSGNRLTDDIVGQLLDSPLPRQLKRLVLVRNAITDGGASALASHWPTGADDRLENLNLRFTYIGSAGQRDLLARFGGRVDLF
jgi:uncharacterized protein (TIGR02996 family)